MPTDALLQLQSQTTSTATAHSAGKTLPKVIMLKPFYVRFIYSAATNASGSNSVTFGVSVSYDNGNTWHEDFIADDKAISLSTTAQQGEFTIPVQITRADLVQPGVIADSTHAVQIRADAVFSGAGSSPSVTWQSEIQPARV